MLEVMITGGLFLLITAMMISLLLPSFALFRKQGGQSDAYRACLQTVERFRKEMLNTQLECVTLTTDGRAIAWQESQADPPFSGTTGEPMMSDVFSALYYRDQRVVLTRSEPTGAGPSTLPKQLSLAEVAALQALPPGRTLAHNITAFMVADNDADPDLVTPPLRLSLTCTVDTKGKASNDEESFSMNVSITPRGQRW